MFIFNATLLAIALVSLGFFLRRFIRVRAEHRDAHAEFLARDYKSLEQFWKARVDVLELERRKQDLDHFVTYMFVVCVLLVAQLVETLP